MGRISKVNILFLLFIVSAGVQVFSFALYMPEDPEVRDLVLLYSRAGYIFPDESFPISLADLNSYAVRLHRLSDNRMLRKEISGYIKHLDYKKGRTYRKTDTNLELAGFLDRGRYIPGDQGTGIEYTRYPNDFYSKFVRFPDLAYFSFSAGFQGESGLFFSGGLKREYHPDAVPYSNLFLSTSSDPAKFENYFVRRGYLAWKTGPFEFRFGRAPVHYGDAEFSTFLPSDKLPWLDTFTYRYTVGPLTMTSYFGTIDSRISNDEESLLIGYPLYPYNNQTVEFVDSSTHREPVLQVGGTDTDFSFMDTLIFNSMHRFILHWDKLRLGFTSLIIVARENNAIQIGDLFPIFVWHNAVLGSNNMNLVFDAGYVPFPGLSIYGQAAWDDINARVVGIPDSSVPTIGAYLFGFLYVPEFAEKNNASLKMEIGTTHYLWGNYYAYDDWKGAYLSRAIYRYHAQKGTYWMPLTSPYGPGTWWISGKAKMSFFHDFNFSGGFTYLRFNSNVNLFTTDYNSNPSLENFNSTSFSLYLESDFTYPLNERSDLKFSLTPSWYSYKGHAWPEVEIAVKFESSRVKNLR